MIFKNLAVVACGFVLLTTPLALAAQNAVVTHSRAGVHEKPSMDSKVLEYVDTGDKIRISSHHKEGFYKIKTKNSGYGWIWQADIALDQEDPNVRVANLELATHNTTHNYEHRADRYKKRLFIRASGFGFGLLSSNVSKKVGYSGVQAYYLSFGGFFDLGIGITEELRVLARVGYYSGSKSISKDPNTYDIVHSSMPVLLGLEGDFYTRNRFQMSGALYAGVGLNSTLTVTASNAMAPNSFSVAPMTLAALVDVSFRYSFSNTVSIFSEIGAIYSQSSSQKIEQDFNGSESFKDETGQLAGVLVSHIGPYVSLGLQLAF